MLFNTIDFLLFFIIVFTLYYFLKSSVKYQNILLLIASYFFYGYWDWRFTGLLLFSSVLDFFCGKKIYHSKSDITRKYFLFLSCLGNLGVLAFFKYFNFFADSFVDLISVFGFKINPFTLNILLPVGISFYTFQTLAYSLDIYRKKFIPENNFINFCLYVSFFPQLVAGPIERPHRLLKQINNQRSFSFDKIYTGLLLILLGLFKKVAIADFLAYSLVEVPFANPADSNCMALWIGVYSFALQIYGDFSGYSDIARGVSRVFGFELIENFQQPYLSMNITDFWRRWHVSLSSWLRDYLYISLGGNRKGKIRTKLNLMITMLLGGLWHGASWTFVIWGGIHGFYLMVHKIILKGKKAADIVGSAYTQKITGIIKIFLTFNLVCLTWVFFRAQNFQTAKIYLIGMFNFNNFNFNVPLLFIYAVIALLIFDIPQYRKKKHDIIADWHPVLQGTVILIMIIAIFIFQPPEVVPFIYFQF